MIEEFLDYLKGKELIYLYGAGKFGRRILHICQYYGIQICGFIVSQKENNPYELEGIRIWTLEELKRESEDKISSSHVVLSIAGEQNKFIDLLEDVNFKSIWFCSNKFQLELRKKEEELRQNEFCRKLKSSLPKEYAIALNYPGVEQNHIVVIEQTTQAGLFRIYNSAEICDESYALAAKESKWQFFEVLYGKIGKLPYVDEAGFSDKLTEIYVATSHLDEMKKENALASGYIPIQVGAALTKRRKGCITDDTGIHISKQNSNYCECTGLYWIWKNTAGQDYVGLNHYGRRMNINDSSITYIRKEQIDIVLAMPEYTFGTIREFFRNLVAEKDWKLIKKYVSNYDPEYELCFKQYEQSHFFFPCNICLCKREWFDQYCEFAFSIAEQIDDYYKEKGYIRNDRYMGYLFENLESLFIMRHHKEMKIVYSDIVCVKKIYNLDE